jgi:hypothetical protein
MNFSNKKLAQHAKNNLHMIELLMLEQDNFTKSFSMFKLRKFIFEKCFVRKAITFDQLLGKRRL